MVDLRKHCRAFWNVGDIWFVSYTDPECNAKWMWHIRYYGSDQQNKYFIKRIIIAMKSMLISATSYNNIIPLAHKVMF